MVRRTCLEPKGPNIPFPPVTGHMTPDNRYEEPRPTEESVSGQNKQWHDARRVWAFRHAAETPIV